MQDNDITDSIRSGEYFNRARVWYNQLYHSPIAERSYLIIITLIAVTTTLFSIRGLFGLLPISPDMPFYIETTDITAEPNISAMADATEDPNISVLRYMLEQYVIAREEYNLKTYKPDQLFVSRQSASDVAAAYVASIALNNPMSPAVRYQDQFERHIKIKDIGLFQTEGADTGTATVRFVSQLTGAASETQEWVANISFRFTNITIDQNTGDITPMNFLVTGYDVLQKQAGTQ